ILGARGVDWPAPLHQLDVVDSTNDWLKPRVRLGAGPWPAVRADRQSGGRGRGGNGWVSPPGNLFLSLVLPPPRAPVTLVPLLVGGAVAEAVGEWGVAARLKWPNDVLVGEHKLAGILVETSSEAGGAPAGLRGGVGLNLSLGPHNPPG